MRIAVDTNKAHSRPGNVAARVSAETEDSMELLKASQQWSTRPADERFWTLTDLDAECRRHRDTARTAETDAGSLRTTVDAGEVLLQGKSRSARLTHWAFGQLARRVGAPAEFLRGLKPETAATVLNEKLPHDSAPASMMFHENGSLLCRAITSDKYSRIWNAEITGRLLSLDGWIVPPAYAHAGDPRARPATAADCGSHTRIQPGDMIGPAGLYASAHDMFAFLIHPDRTVKAGERELFRGVMVWNSEVGASSLGALRFALDVVCGNHICWGAANVQEFKLRHIGAVGSRFDREFVAELKEYADESTTELDAVIKRAMSVRIAGDKEAVIDALFGKVNLSRKALSAGFDRAAAVSAYGDPRSPWGMVGGLTELSQETAYADERTAMDRAAGKLLQF